VLGKRVIHPGSRRSTQQLLELAGLAAGQHVLDIGCGVATTAIQAAQRFHAHVTAADLSPLMLARAHRNVAAGLDGHVKVEQADILPLPYPDGAFGRIIAEAITMFVDRPWATAELARVCRPDGRVLATEFCWQRHRRPRPARRSSARSVPGLQVDTVQRWSQLDPPPGSPASRSPTAVRDDDPRGFLADEGLTHALAIAARAMSRPSYLRKMAWLMPRMQRAVPHLGCVVIGATKTAA
jgi:SAM-dependent methyltransferase